MSDDQRVSHETFGKVEHFRLGWLLAGVSRHLAASETLCLWPPDVFALVAAVLEATGCYVPYLRRLNGAQRAQLAKGIVELGAGWRRRLEQAPGASMPAELTAAWHCLRAHFDLPLQKVSSTPALQKALHCLLGAADEASEGLGYPHRGSDQYHAYAQLCLFREKDMGATLCSPRISPEVARVLPKMHTPQGGLSLRSLSRNLALFPGLAIRPFWFNVESDRPMTSFNLLLVPWPETVTPNQFREAGRDGGHTGSPCNGYFTYQIPGDKQQAETKFRNLLARARDIVDRIDGVVFPELALKPDAYQQVQKEAAREGCFLVAGVGAPSGDTMENLLHCDYPYHGTRVPWSRGKHHRWRLDRGQVLQYGLGGALHTQVQWWEKIPLGERTLGFFSLAPRFTMCSLICEDLAQQDPLGYLMRSVGPNFVVALLMDGPQIAQRWSSRYASVLADDPGSSVLTLTSLGMSTLCRPHGLPAKRVIALWKDARSGSPVEIELPPRADGAVLHISVETAIEATADGRTGAAAFPVLGGVHFVSRD